MKCTNRDNVSDIEDTSKSKVLGNEQSGNEKKSNKKFVPSSLSDGAGGSRKQEKNENTIRVSNISENAVENDIRVLFDRCGYIRRLHYKVGKGYAFITFDNIIGCQEAIKQIDRHPYDYLVLCVEMADNKK